jgi:signal recognition particle subunit SRP54
LSPSWPSADAPCPHCGSLVWFPAERSRSAPAEPALPADFTLDDFRKQFEQLQKMGPMRDVLASMPGMSDTIPDGEDPEQALKRIQGMIDSMTKEERRNPDLIDMGRRRRIAAGSGTTPHDIKQFLGQFDQVRTLMRQMARMSIWERI